MNRRKSSPSVEQQEPYRRGDQQQDSGYYRAGGRGNDECSTTVGTARQGSHQSFYYQDSGMADYDIGSTILPQQDEGGRSTELDTWLKYARGVIDSTIDTAVGNEQQRKFQPPSNRPW